MWSAVRLYSETSGNSKAMAAKNAHPTMATVAISLSRRGSTRIVDADTVLPSLGNSLPALLNDTPLAHKCASIKGLFTQLRGRRILRSSLPASNAQVTAKIAHLSDTPAPMEEYGAKVADKGTLWG